MRARFASGYCELRAEVIEIEGEEFVYEPSDEESVETLSMWVMNGEFGTPTTVSGAYVIGMCQQTIEFDSKAMPWEAEWVSP
jgi:hypothetical protein